MVLQAVVAIAWLVWLCSGTAGLKRGVTVGALLVIGLAVKRFLDSYWKARPKEGEKPRQRELAPQPLSLSPQARRGTLPSPRWSLPRYGPKYDA
jgi:hypothetical protein